MKLNIISLGYINCKLYSILKDIDLELIEGNPKHGRIYQPTVDPSDSKVSMGNW